MTYGMYGIFITTPCPLARDKYRHVATYDNLEDATEVFQLLCFKDIEMCAYVLLRIIPLKIGFYNKSKL